MIHNSTLQEHLAAVQAMSPLPHSEEDCSDEASDHNNNENMGLCSDKNADSEVPW